MSKAEILIVDDDREMRTSLTHLLEAGGYSVTTAKDGREGLISMGQHLPDTVVCDVRMPGMNGLEFQRQAAERFPVPVVLFSAHGDIPMAVEAIQNGAYNFIEKPFDPRRLLTLIGNAIRLKRLQDNTRQLESRLAAVTDLEGILIGDTPQMRSVRQSIYEFSGLPASVLITGATGTGKELVARALHDLGPGPSAPFVAVNCAVIPPERFEETVFGSGETLGLMRRADGGTLFLDELTAMPPETQSKLLRAVETKTCEPLGAKPIAVALRIVSATSESPAAFVRTDLLFRLNTLMIDLPKLAERGNDVLLLFRHYQTRFSALYDVSVPELSPSDVSALLTHDWPGNVRELQSVAERHVLMAKRGPSSVPEAIKGEEGAEVPSTLREAVAVFERELITKALISEEGRMDDAAASLGIGRRTLNEKIVKLGIRKDRLFSES